MKSFKKQVKEIIESYGHGLPACPDELSQCDWWQEDAIDILDEICSALGLYDVDKYTEDEE